MPALSYRSHLSRAEAQALVSAVRRSAIKPTDFLDDPFERDAAALCFFNIQAAYNEQDPTRTAECTSLAEYLDRRAEARLGCAKIKPPFLLRARGGKLGDLATAFGRYLWIDRELWLARPGKAGGDYCADMLGRTLRRESEHHPASQAIADYIQRVNEGGLWMAGQGGFFDKALARVETAEAALREADRIALAALKSLPSFAAKERFMSILQSVEA